MIFQSLGTMFVFMMVSSFTPGPGNILALNTMIRYGWREGKKLILGIICGYFTVQYICTFAVLGLNRYAHSVFSILKYFGAAYLVWLAFHILFVNNEEKGQEKKASFFVGFGMQIVNMKIYFYITTLLTAYIMPIFWETWQVIIIGLFVVGIGSTATMTWALAGIKLQDIYTKHEKIINVILTLLLLYCAISIAK